MRDVPFEALGQLAEFYDTGQSICSKDLVEKVGGLTGRSSYYRIQIITRDYLATRCLTLLIILRIGSLRATLC